MARPLAALMAEAAGRTMTLPADVVVPVPLHAVRYRERGFNQAELLAREVAQRLCLPFGGDVLKRTKATGMQSALSRTERKRNVRGAFAPGRGISGGALLIDDVFSTGFTVSECARVLKAAGADHVLVLTAATAVRGQTHDGGVRMGSSAKRKRPPEHGRPPF